MMFPAIEAARPASPKIIVMRSAVWRAMLLDENKEAGGGVYPS
jgi:hypothetical protein